MPSPRLQTKSSNQGQSLVEYIVLISLSVSAAAFMSRVTTSAFQKVLVSFCAQLETDLHTGRLKKSVWN
jgi:hypothetical protein